MRRTRGFTMVELILSIVLLGILAATVSVIIQKPLEGQIRAQRRTEISDIADTALRRAGRDVRLAVPNSVRVTGAGPVYLELLLTRTGGRYRSQEDDGTLTGEDPLNFAAADDVFDTLGNLSTAGGAVAENDIVVIHNLGISGANAWAGDNTALVDSLAVSPASASEDRITLKAPKLFPIESPGRRFQVASGPVTIECVPGAVDANGNGMGVMRRYSGYALNATQPTPPGGLIALLATNVTTCNIEYTSLPLTARGLVAFTIGVSRGGEAVTLYYEAHISNVP
jgi:MSHA biogenesis protein MshO